MPAPKYVIFEFNNPPNVSLQSGSGFSGLGDDVYFSTTVSHGGYSTVDPNIPSTFTVYVGKCGTVQYNPVTLFWEVIALMDGNLSQIEQDAIINTFNPANCFVHFSKNTETNRNSLLGYYAEVTLGNDSPGIAELFAVSTEASQSSK